ncbi:LysM peptidoglycan-binding domain-containing protein [bacterium]|nr:LysM peptidoglycan-binding domain-containing protein [bacterium]
MKKHLMKIIIIITFTLLGVYFLNKQYYYTQVQNNISATSTIRDQENQTEKYSQDEYSQSKNKEIKTEIKYVIKKGDTLWDLAEKYYGSGFEYHKIIEKNPGKTFKFADGRQGLIYEGTEIII